MTRRGGLFRLLHRGPLYLLLALLAGSLAAPSRSADTVIAAPESRMNVSFPDSGHTDSPAPETLAIETPLGHPWGVAFGRDGHLFFSDALKQQIYHLDDEGMIEIVAGSGVRGYSEEVTWASRSIFNGPTSLALGPDGLLYIADTRNHQVRRIEKDKRLTVVAGRGPGEGGSGGYSGDGGPAAFAQLDAPHGIDFDAEGNLYIADTGNHRIRKVLRPGPEGVIATAAGDGQPGTSGDGKPATSARLNSPMDVAVGPEGRILIADRYGARIREVMPDGTIRTLAGGGSLPLAVDAPALKVKLGTPTAVLYGRDGSVLFADAQLRAVVRIRDGIVAAVIGGRAPEPVREERGSLTLSAPEAPTLLTGPVGLTLHPQGGFVIADWSGHRILHVGEEGTLRVLAGNGEDASLIASEPPRRTPPPYSLRAAALTPDGEIVITDSVKGEILKWEQGRLWPLEARNGNGAASNGANGQNGTFYGPSGILTLPDGSIVFSEARSHRVRRITPEGKIETIAGIGAPGFTGDGKPGTQTRLWSPAGLAQDSAGNLYIADSRNHRIRKLAPHGLLTTAAGGSDAPVQRIAAERRRAGAATTDAAQSPPASSLANATPSEEAGRPPAPPRLKQPMDVAVNSSGALVVADTGNSLVRRVREDGEMETLAGGGGQAPVPGLPARNGTLAEPVALAFSPTGELAVADARDHRVWIISADGLIRHVLGSGRDEGDGESEQNRLNRPTGLAYDQQGNLHIVCKDRIIQFTPSGRLVTLADRRTPGWGETDEPEEDAGTLSGRMKNALQRFREARRTPKIGWRAAPRVTMVGPREAMVTWETEVPAWSVVEYGQRGRMNETHEVTSLATRPVVTLRGLQPGTEYLFRVRAYRNSGALREEIVSRGIRFTTRADGEGFITIAPPVETPPAETNGQAESETLDERIERLREQLNGP